MSYPVGDRFARNIPYMDALADEVIKFYKDKEEVPLLVVRGSSGILIGGFIAHKFNTVTSKEVGVCVLRKTDNHHSTGDFEYRISNAHDNGTPLVIVDDLISSGRTMQAIYDKMSEAASNITIDAIFVTGSDSIKMEDELKGIKLNHLFVE
jgi:adenine/guanine phosphoribosyltransferase-like PRPP-binding protein